MAKIDTSKIEGYAEMSAEDKLAALENFEYEDNAAEVKRLKEACSKACTDAADWKRKYRTLASEKEDDQGKDSETVLALTEELSSVRQELTVLRKEKTIAEYRANFTSQGYPADLAADTAKAMADGDTAKVFANQQKFLEGYAKTVRADALKKTPRPPAGASSTAMTKDEIMAIKDNQERQAAIGANLELFTKF